MDKKAGGGGKAADRSAKADGGDAGRMGGGVDGSRMGDDAGRPEQGLDRLTGLRPGSAMSAGMEGLIAKEAEFSLIILDIDNLMALNRDFGHDAGDAVFRLIADSIRQAFPEPCEAFRDTRDQFDVLLPGISKERAFLLAEGLRASVAGEDLGYASNKGERMAQTVSVGVAAYPEDGGRPAELARKAASALDRAKKGGRNAVCLAREEKLLPKTSHYTQTQLEKLTAISERTGVAEAALMREALDILLKAYDEAMP